MLAEVVRHTKAATKRQAVLEALDDFNRRRRQAKLVEHFGTFKDFMTPQELKRMRNMD